MIEVLLASVRISTAYLLAAAGGVCAERAGVINMALEAGLLMGALGFALAADHTGSPWLGLLAAAGAGGAVMAVHAACCVLGRANQVIVGVGLNLVAAGAGRLVLKLTYNSAANGPRVSGFEDTWWRALTELPWLGPALATPVVVLAPLCVLLVHVILHRTPWGTWVKAVGEHPVAAATQGIPVPAVRMAAVCAGGLLVGLGGASLAAEQHQFTQGMSAGRGFIAVAAVVFGGWEPARVALGCLVFGLAEAAQIHVQSAGWPLPHELVQMTPYLVTLGVLASSRQRRGAPGALGQAYPP